jgi:LysR family cyn operon transcriptional activator
MELRQLRYFIKAAELLNFTEAAQASFITESTLSQQIKQLEIELGALLFKREKRKVILTEIGERFLPYAVRTVADADESVRLVKDLQQLRTGTLRIGCTYSFTIELSKVLLKFCKAYPDVNVSVERHTANVLIDKLYDHKLDLVICFEPQKTDSQLKCIPLFTTLLSVVVHRSHPLADVQSISVDELNRYAVALPNTSLFSRRELDHALYYRRKTISPQLEWNDVNLALRFLETGHWLTVLPQTCLKNESDFRTIPFSDLEVKLKAVQLSLHDVYEKDTIKTFSEFLNLLPL